MCHDVNVLHPATRRPAATPAVAGHQPLAIVLPLAACFAADGPTRAQPSGAQAVVGSATLNLVNGKLDASSAQGGGGSVDVLGNGVALFGAAQVIDGNFTQTPAGTLVMEIAGTAAGTEYDQLGVLGAPSSAARSRSCHSDRHRPIPEHSTC